MIKKLILVAVIVMMLTGCQFKLTNSKDFTPRQTINSEDVILNKTFIQENKVLVGLGDSLTQGVGDERKLGGYIGRFSSEVSTFKGVEEVEVNNLAKRGRRSDQLLHQLESGEINYDLKQADMILMTIGGNDVMAIVKEDFFELKIEAFEKELILFSNRYSQILKEIRDQNPNAPLILMGLYNPFSVVTDEVNEFDYILNNWNKSIKKMAERDSNACYVPVDDLFNTNANLIYHTDFFHPNSKGYEQMSDRIFQSIQKCGLKELTNGEMDF
jgi:lysophospholipase L1-like esterase